MHCSRGARGRREGAWPWRHETAVHIKSAVRQQRVMNGDHSAPVLLFITEVFFLPSHGVLVRFMVSGIYLHGTGLQFSSQVTSYPQIVQPLQYQWILVRNCVNSSSTSCWQLADQTRIFDHLIIKDTAKGKQLNSALGFSPSQRKSEEWH